MSEEIIKVLDALSEKIDLSIEWTQWNIIPYLEQLCVKYVRYEIATSIVWILIAIVIFAIGVKAYKEAKKNNGDIQCLLVIITFLFVIISIAILSKQVFDIVTCITFPEKIIINEIKSIYSSLNSTR